MLKRDLNLLETHFLVLLCYVTPPVPGINRSIHIIQCIAGEHTVTGTAAEGHKRKGNINPAW